MAQRKKVVNITVDEQKWKRFKAVAKANNRNASMLIRDFIEEYLAKNAQMTISEFE